MQGLCPAAIFSPWSGASPLKLQDENAVLSVTMSQPRFWGPTPTRLVYECLCVGLWFCLRVDEC